MGDVRVAERHRDVLLSGNERQRPPLQLDPLPSAIAATLVVQLLVAGALIEDRHRRPPAPTGRAFTESPSPSPPELPSISAAEEAARLRTAQNVARFAAGLICTDATGFAYTVLEHNRDVSVAMVAGGSPGSAPAFVIKVTRLPGGISYSVQESSEPCRG